MGAMRALFPILIVSVTAAHLDVKNDKCSYCSFLVDTFQAEFARTARQHFAGGDTAWEEKNLGKYATSETRLIEILEGVCKKKSLANTDKFNGLSDLEFKCSALFEEHEEAIEDYYYHNQDQDMYKSVCIDTLKVCCASDHFGKDCTKCPGLQPSGFPCYGHGKCHGNGSRQGTGKCKCDTGYVGHMCSQCDSDYYEASKDEKSIRCEKCFDGCTGGCSGGSAKDCKKCRSGYRLDDELGCIDVDECAAEVSPCGVNEKCTNSPGLYTCDCKDGYKKVNGVCELDIHASPAKALLPPDLLLRSISMISLVAIITLVVWKRSIILIVITTVAVILIVFIETSFGPDSIPDEAKRILAQ